MMTDPKAGKANIKKKKPVPNYLGELLEQIKDPPHVFQRNSCNVVNVEVSDYNSKAGSLEL